MECLASSCSQSAVVPLRCLCSNRRLRRAVANCQTRPLQRGCWTAATAQGSQRPKKNLAEDGPSTSGRDFAWDRRAAAWVAATAAAAALLPAGAAQASSGGSGEGVDPGLLEFVVTSIEALGPLGPGVFVTMVAIFECIPLFPTQPFSLASGLLFGTQKGALCMLSGTTLAALIAFLIARGVGRPLAEQIISRELSDSGGGAENGAQDGAGPVQRKLTEVQAVIERGSFWQQAGAVLLLRMTPVVPFSVSNYMLGLSPLPLAPYLAGTAAGMAFWAVFYASLGGASRSLLVRGVNPGLLLADLGDRAGQYTRELGTGAALLGMGTLLYFGVGAVRQRLAGADDQNAGAHSSDGADQKHGSEIGGDLSHSSAVGQDVVSKGLEEWLGAAGDKELAESRYKE